MFPVNYNFFLSFSKRPAKVYPVRGGKGQRSSDSSPLFVLLVISVFFPPPFLFHLGRRGAPLLSALNQSVSCSFAEKWRRRQRPVIRCHQAGLLNLDQQVFLISFFLFLFFFKNSQRGCDVPVSVSRIKRGWTEG